jgi:hypothetical protein
MKAFAFFVLTLLTLCCCDHDTNSQTIYLPEYKKYEKPVATKWSAVDKAVADSARAILNTYLQAIEIYSCTWCIAEGPVFMPVAAFTARHPESMIFVLHSSLQGTRLSWGFRALFKELYRAQYDALLAEANIVLLPDQEVQTEDQRWQNQSKEHSLAFTRLVDKYLEIIH